MMSNNCYGQKVNMTIKEDGSNRIKKNKTKTADVYRGSLFTQVT